MQEQFVDFASSVLGGNVHLSDLRLLLTQAIEVNALCAVSSFKKYQDGADSAARQKVFAKIAGDQLDPVLGDELSVALGEVRAQATTASPCLTEFASIFVSSIVFRFCPLFFFFEGDYCGASILVASHGSRRLKESLFADVARPPPISADLKQLTVRLDALAGSKVYSSPFCI